MPKFQGDKKIFAAIPARAFRDVRMHGRHLRLLGIIALHDRLNHNGAGCYAARSKLAKLLSWSESNVSYIAAALRDWGYIEITVKSGRAQRGEARQTYRVNYEYALDHNWRNRCNPLHLSELDRYRPQHLSDADRYQKTPPTGTKISSEIGASPSDDKGTPSQAYASKHISKNLRGDEEAYCAEARSRRRRNLTPEQAKKYLDNCENILASGTDSERQQLRLEHPQLESISTDNSYPAEDRDRASRLLIQSNE